MFMDRFFFLYLVHIVKLRDSSWLLDYSGKRLFLCLKGSKIEVNSDTKFY